MRARRGLRRLMAYEPPHPPWRFSAPRSARHSAKDRVQRVAAAAAQQATKTSRETAGGTALPAAEDRSKHSAQPAAGLTASAGLRAAHAG